MARVTKSKFYDECHKQWDAIVEKYGNIRVDRGTHGIDNTGCVKQNVINYARCDAFFSLSAYDTYVYQLNGKFSANETIKKLTEYTIHHFDKFSEMVGDSAKKLNLGVDSSDETLKKAVELVLYKKETQFFWQRIKNQAALSELVSGINKQAILRAILNVKKGNADSKPKAESYAVEPYGNEWQSVFPEKEAELSMLHASRADAEAYIKKINPNAKL